MIKKALEFLTELRDSEMIDVGGVDHIKSNYKKFSPPTPVPLELHTLAGIIAFVCTQAPDMVSAPVVHVVTPGLVRVVSPLDLKYRVREEFARAELVGEIFPFGRNLPIDEFIIGIQAMFVQDDTTAAILRLVGNITAQAELRTEDDGVSQNITARTGLVKKEQAQVPNPVMLRPYRTFREVDQPASRFVLRINAGTNKTPTVALHEADGGMWELEATKNIAAYLDRNMDSPAKILA